MEPRYILYAKRSLFFVLSLLLFLSLFTLTPNHVFAKDPYDDLIDQLQALKKQMAELLAQYNSLDADSRAMLDASVAEGARQSIEQIYGSLSDSEKAYVDEQMRQMMGCSFTQYIQSMTSVPALVNGVDALCSAIENLSSGAQVHENDQPPVIELPTPSAFSEPQIPSSNPPQPSNTVGFSTEEPELKISIGWQLFSDPNMSDETALRKYNDNVDARIEELKKKKAAAEKRRADLEKVKGKSNVNAYIDKLKKDLELAKADGVKAWDQFYACLFSEVRSLVLEWSFNYLEDRKYKGTKIYNVLDAISKGEDFLFTMFPALMNLKDKIKMGKKITANDLAEAGEAVADIADVLNSWSEGKTGLNLGLKVTCIGARLISKLADVKSTQMEIDNIQKTIQQLSDSRDYSDSTLQHKIDVETMKIEEYDRQIEQLMSQGGYIDPKYLNT